MKKEEGEKVARLVKGLHEPVPSPVHGKKLNHKKSCIQSSKALNIFTEPSRN
jgi:hypothetical protein